MSELAEFGAPLEDSCGTREHYWTRVLTTDLQTAQRRIFLDQVVPLAKFRWGKAGRYDAECGGSWGSVLSSGAESVSCGAEVISPEDDLFRVRRTDRLLSKHIKSPIVAPVL